MARTFHKAIITDADLPARETLPGNMLKDAEFLRLWDVYSPLLTRGGGRSPTSISITISLSAKLPSRRAFPGRACPTVCTNAVCSWKNTRKNSVSLQALREASLDCSRLLTRVTRWAEAQRGKAPRMGGGAGRTDPFPFGNPLFSRAGGRERSGQRGRNGGADARKKQSK